MRESRRGGQWIGERGNTSAVMVRPKNERRVAAVSEEGPCKPRCDSGGRHEK